MWLLVFIVVPIVEMYLLIEVGGYIGSLPTIGLVMLTAVIGVAVLKRQGAQTLTKGLTRMNRGEAPLEEMAEGILLAVAGALLLTPGFVTDFIGFSFLLPQTRLLIARAMLKRVSIMPGAGPAGFQRSAPFDGPYEPNVIEGDFQRRP
ncbi:MAG: FxsA family protein [Proteobacteria bacterium]|nr:FxsA family protein [Pseudomonadota bacterium]